MKILHIVEDFSLHSGGLRTVIKNLDFYLKSANHTSYILTSNKEDLDDVYLFKGKNKWLYSSSLFDKIDVIVKEKGIEIIHIHGVWLYPQYIGAKYAVKHSIPFILTPHGMYQPWLWKKGRLKKNIYFYLFSKKWYSKATFIHSITANETQNLRKLFKKNRFVEIPNLITLEDLSHELIEKDKYILYLGRLNKTKGIDLLIKAFSMLENSELKLRIAGASNAYKKKLEALVISLKLNKKVEFLGLVQDKRKLMSNAWIMVSPSFSDVIGMVNLEAASFKTPMITTYRTGLKVGWNTNGGKLIKPTIVELKKALDETLDWTSKQRNSEGQKLYDFVEKNYSWKSRFQDWIDLYERTINGEK